MGKILVSIAVCWDALTTVLGTLAIIGRAPLQVLAAVVLAVIILGLLFSTPKLPKEKGWASTFLRTSWALALAYDLYTSYVGNRDIIMGGTVEGRQYVIVIGLTVLVTISPMFLSLVWRPKSQ